MKHRTRLRYLRSCVVLLAVLAAGGCTLLKPAPDKSRYFVLSSLQANAGAPAATHPEVRIGLGPVNLPGYLDSQGLVRTGDGTVEYVHDAFWAEPLASAFPRALLYRTAARIGTTNAVAYPWYSTTRVDWKIPVDVLRFDALADGRGVLVARWRVERTSDGAVVAGSQSSFEEAGGSDAAQVVDALSRCVDHLADTIAGAVIGAASAPAATSPKKTARPTTKKP
ncbi:MAG TPA: PqiC family protein [Candidatus Binatia bacterium]|jgi:hypothetical protein